MNNVRVFFMLLAGIVYMGEHTPGLAADRGVILEPGIPEKPVYPSPEYLPEPVPRGKILPNLPPVPETEDQLSVISVIPVKQIVLEKTTVLSDQELQEIFKEYLAAKTISHVALHELRHKLSLAYFNKGYVNSGVIIPDQKVTQGIIRLRAIEGQLVTINVQGGEHLNTEYLRSRIRQGSGTPFNVDSLQKTLAQIKQDPLIKNIKAALQPGLALGESHLQVNIENHEPKYVYIGVNNHRSPSVGSEQAFIQAGHRNIFGIGDRASVQFSYAEGLGDTTLSYGAPLNQPKSTRLQLYYATSESDVIEEPFDQIDIENESRTAGLSLTHQFITSMKRHVEGVMGFEIKHSETTLLGVPFSFSPGVNNGEADVSVVQLGLDWIERERDSAQTIGAALRVGIDALDATINDDAPDGEFVSLQGQYQYAQRFGSPTKQWIFKTFLQWTEDRLLPIEKFAVGGSSSVRGYRENEFVRDNGWVASLELQFPLPGFSDIWAKRITLVAFVDHGRSWDNDDALASSEPENISSAGIGMHWQPTPAWNIEGYYGHAFEDISHNSSDLQDDGIHFQLSYQLL